MIGRGRFDRGLWLVVALILFGLVSHHCVLPTSAEAGASHHHGEPESGHGEHAIHAVPCDVVVAKATSAAAGPVLSSASLVFFAPLRHQPDVQPNISSAVCRTGPPLYVLHASLLI
jgi:hypothetical protein